MEKRRQIAICQSRSASVEWDECEKPEEKPEKKVDANHLKLISWLEDQKDGFDHNELNLLQLHRRA